MWPFRDRKSSRQMREILSRFMTPEAVDSLLKGDPSERTRRKRLFFLLIEIRDKTIEETPEVIGRVGDLLMQSGGVVEQLSSLLLATFGGVPFALATASETLNMVYIERLAARLTTEFGPNLRIVCGESDGLFGSVGGSNRLHYGALIPCLGNALKTLLVLDYGRSSRV
jgi:hypothetical protein